MGGERRWGWVGEGSSDMRQRSQPLNMVANASYRDVFPSSIPCPWGLLKFSLLISADSMAMLQSGMSIKLPVAGFDKELHI